MRLMSIRKLVTFRIHEPTWFLEEDFKTVKNMASNYQNQRCKIS
jgi:hypothetical protein